MQAMEQMYETDLSSLDVVFRGSLGERRSKLKDAIAENGSIPEFNALLLQVDTALAKLDHGTFGKCERCDGFVETGRLLADPLVRFCLGELTDAEKRSLENDLQLASAIQRGLLPQMSLGHGSWKSDFVYEPLGPVSGDYCDVIPAGDDLYFILGDVSGKGMAASLLMSSLRAIFHSLIPLDLELCDLMSRTNRLLVDSSPSNQFATLILGKASRDGELEIVNAGHLPPILVKNGMKGELNFSGLPLGMFAETPFSMNKINLNRGDSLLLFTDGVTEAVNESGTEFGAKGVFDALDGEGFAEPSDLIQKCLDSVSAHRGNALRTDDLTVLALMFS